jgi:nicotinic acid mononucleotide adenylyltransferase
VVHQFFSRLPEIKSPIKKGCIIALGGSFNPIHKSHIAVLKRAKAHLESKGHCVVAAYLAVAHFSHVKSKLVDERAALSNQQRLALCKLAIEEEGEPQSRLRFSMHHHHHLCGRM